MADTLIMRWPGLGKQVRCDKIGHNQHIFDWFVDQLPTRAVDGHTVVSGWLTRVCSMPMKKRYNWTSASATMECMSEVPDGRVLIDTPVGEVLKMMTKYGQATENIDFITMANVREEDLPTLRDAGKAIWAAVAGTHEVILVEFVKAEGS